MSSRTSSTIGGGIFLAAVGAILTYAITANLGGVDIDTVGVILMVAGFAIVLIGLFLGFTDGMGNRSERTVEQRDARGDVVRRTEERVG